MDMFERRLTEVGAKLLIRNGVVALMAPRRLSRSWQAGPKPYQDFVETFIQRPILTRVVSLGQVALGVWLSRRHVPR